MKKTLIDKIPYSLPEDFSSLRHGAKFFDSSCSPEARVYFIEKDLGYYLKINKAKELKNEAVMTDYFHSKGLGAEEAAVWTILSGGECDFDALCEQSGMDPEELGALLMMMELDGFIEALAGLRYRLA